MDIVGAFTGVSWQPDVALTLAAFHFARSFKVAMGMSPHAFLLQRSRFTIDGMASIRRRWG